MHEQGPDDASMLDLERLLEVITKKDDRERERGSRTLRIGVWDKEGCQLSWAKKKVPPPMHVGCESCGELSLSGLCSVCMYVDHA